MIHIAVLLVPFLRKNDKLIMVYVAECVPSINWFCCRWTNAPDAINFHFIGSFSSPHLESLHCFPSTPGLLHDVHRVESASSSDDPVTKPLKPLRNLPRVVFES